MASRLLASIVRKGGSKLLDLGLGRVFPLGPDRTEAAEKPKPGLTKAVAGAVLTRIATRSVPGAIFVGGGILAKTLYDRRRARRGKAGDDDT